MQIVIDISEEIKAIIDKNGTNEIVTETLWQAVKNGTPLPEHHGRLIDADAIQKYQIDTFGKRLLVIDTASTIIEADKEVQE